MEQLDFDPVRMEKAYNQAVSYTHLDVYKRQVLRFTVMNSSGVYMEFTNWGARWITASVPDVQGALDNVLIIRSEERRVGKECRL